MNEMNSLTHSCMHSFASFAILALSGSAIFMIRATGAKLRMLASEAELLFAAAPFGVDCGGEVEDCGEEDDISQAARRTVSQAHKEPDWLAAASEVRDSTQRRASGESVGIQRRPLEQSVDVQMGARRCANQKRGKRQGK
jgi:hypothetical protein